ncbi:YopT-type cysteine protease domain-containing protein [Methylomonas sp. SURF-1]|uniref:YopT-type cysteine protease domain-containing protein n=1 Tax=Methylomonas aurea TaxID=2952224 RepID=A0ABT1UK18_9GAMM|nr:YopT-type cysteine protease domain-containing protein [Methylomonas sp. SURF-1]MCQ8182579.1 YopT-type cysteine protease domain-containing protein [Methylomonas sp. SURF-1]
MEDWLARLCVRHNVEIVHEYNQSEDARTRKDALTEEGWCYGIVLQWLRCKRQAVDFWSWVNTADAEAKIRYPMAFQALAKKPVSGGKLGGVADKYKDSALLLKPYGLKQEFFSEEILKQSASSIVTELQCNKATYFILTIAGDGAHALGVHYSQLYLSFFDPNAGEFAFRRDSIGEFTEWLKWYLTGQGYWATYTGFYVQGFNPD